jgi:hypothetical protein
LFFDEYISMKSLKISRIISQMFSKQFYDEIFNDFDNNNLVDKFNNQIYYVNDVIGTKSTLFSFPSFHFY